MPTIITTEILEIHYDKVFPAGFTTELFELHHGNFDRTRKGRYSSRHREPSFQLVREDGHVEAHADTRDEIDEYIKTTMRGEVLSTT